MAVQAHGSLAGVHNLPASHLPTILPTSLHSSILYLGKDSLSAAGCPCPASSCVGRIQPWGDSKTDQLFSQQSLAACVGLGLSDWEQLISSVLTNP